MADHETAAYKDEYALLLFEDSYFKKLEVLVRKMRKDINPDATLPVEAASVNGYSNFSKEIARALRTPLMRKHDPPSIIIAVGDADRAHEFGAKIPKPPLPPATSNTWIAEAEWRWWSWLKDTTNTTEGQERLAVCLLRWSKENILTASPEMLLEALPEQIRHRSQTFLDACAPPPRTAVPEDFLLYRRPEKCLKDYYQSVNKQFNKNREGDDLLERIANSRQARDRVRARLPDLGRLAQFLAGLG